MSVSIPILSQREIRKMKKAGELAAELKILLRKEALPGVKTGDLDRLAEGFIDKHKVKAAFKGYRGFPANIITCVNQQMVHAIPGDYELRRGDLLTIDLGVSWKGYCSDTAITFYVGEIEENSNFLKAGKTALSEAINQCREGKQLGDVSGTIQKCIELAGFNVARMFTGHGIGRELHQPPEIPCFGEMGTGPKLSSGMGLAVEVMYTAGDYRLKILADGWTTETVDQSLAAQFEETVIVDLDYPLITTLA
jgi:methionyl aminopeptidase